MTCFPCPVFTVGLYERKKRCVQKKSLHKSIAFFIKLDLINVSPMVKHTCMAVGISKNFYFLYD